MLLSLPDLISLEQNKTKHKNDWNNLEKNQGCNYSALIISTIFYDSGAARVYGIVSIEHNEWNFKY